MHYLTATDEATGTGLWVHHETVAPLDGKPYAHGWTAVFPSDGEPTWERFGPLTERCIPKPKILHPHPNDRFYAKHPK